MGLERKMARGACDSILVSGGSCTAAAAAVVVVIVIVVIVLDQFALPSLSTFMDGERGDDEACDGIEPGRTRRGPQKHDPAAVAGTISAPAP